MPENRTDLPRGIPGPLRDFVRCRTDSAELEPGDLDWVPKPRGPMVPENLPDPSVSFAEGEGGAVDITIAWGFLSVTLAATVTDGKLSIRSPSPLVPTGDIDEWVEDLNADLEDNGKQFEDISIVDGKLRATKRAIPPPAEDTAAAVPAAAVAAGSPAESAPSGESASPAEEPIIREGAPPRVRRFYEKWSTGQKAAAGGAGAVALGVAAFFLFTGGGEGTGGTEATPPPVAATSSSTSSTSTSSTTSSTSTTTTTLGVQVPEGTRVGMFEDPPTDAVDCSTQEEVASSLDLSGVEVYDDSGLITFRVHTNGPPAQILDPATGDWSGAVVVDVALPGDVYTTMIAQVHEGDPLVGILDPATGETTPNGVVIADGFVDFGHRFEPPPEEYQVRIQSFHSMGPEEPVACDYMELTVP